MNSNRAIWRSRHAWRILPWWLAVGVVCRAATNEASHSPRDRYNEAVRAYSAGDFPSALKFWEDLSVDPLPPGLDSRVWFQLGNVRFRTGEPLAETTPEQAIEWWRQSCEAYRFLLAGRSREPAAHNLALVESRLADLVHRLGLEAFSRAGNESVSTAIDLLRDSTTRLQEAVDLVPLDTQYRADLDRAEAALRERLLERAGQAEEAGDERARQTNRWAEAAAERQYRMALADLADAAGVAPAPANPGLEPSKDPVAQAQERVSQKLAALLTRLGKAAQEEGDSLSDSSPDEALDEYDTARAKFLEASSIDSQNDAAIRGAREVREAMERLHVNEGTADQQRGREALSRNSPVAARALTTSLGHFETALQLNPQNATARAGAGEARRLLPGALVDAGRAAMKTGERSEPQWSTDALQHYQEAEEDFREALRLKPGQEGAQPGLDEVQPRLARLRQRIAKEAAQAAQQGKQPGQLQPSLESLLGQVDGHERERQQEAERTRQQGQNQPHRRPVYPHW